MSSLMSLQNLMSSLSNLSDMQTQITNEMSSGVRISTLSDDPGAAGQAVSMADALQQDSAFLSSASSAGNRMQAADTALSSVVTQLTSAIGTATGAFNNTGNATMSSAAATALVSIRNTIVSLANSSYGDAYLFSGTSSGMPFSQDASGAVTYNGNDETTSVSLLSGDQVRSSLPGSSLFSATGASVFDGLNQIITTLQSGEPSENAAALVGNLRNALDNVMQQRSSLNSAQSRLSGESDYVTSQKTNLQVQQSQLLAADPASLATELSAVTTQRSALLSTIAIVQKGSLFDYL